MSMNFFALTWSGLFTFLVLALIVAVFILFILRASGRGHAGGAGRNGDAYLLQEMLDGLDRMEQRVEALEVLLKGDSGKGRRS